VVLGVDEIPADDIPQHTSQLLRLGRVQQDVRSRDRHASPSRSSVPHAAGFGTVMTMVLPGGVDMTLYQPRHATAI
jgi:hypothetical protein